MQRPTDRAARVQCLCEILPVRPPCRDRLYTHAGMDDTLAVATSPPFCRANASAARLVFPAPKPCPPEPEPGRPILKLLLPRLNLSSDGRRRSSSVRCASVTPARSPSGSQC